MIHRNIFQALWFWFEMHSGTLNEGGPYYGFFSGIGSDLTELAILGALINHYRNHKCATCWRIGRHPVDGTPYKTCHKHATIAYHAKIHKDHEEQFPAQHALLNKGKE